MIFTLTQAGVAICAALSHPCDGTSALRATQFTQGLGI
jgi:hypothetical protein